MISVVFQSLGQSPHGVELKMNCAQCHSPSGWEVDRKLVSFNHDSTRFLLTGRHKDTDCKSCHPTLVFSEAKGNCFGCHQDVHQETVGKECSRCHNTASWLIDDIKSIHFQNGFPLNGSHALTDCKSCHVSASRLQFERIGNDCINCHRKDFEATDNPNHKNAGFSLDCANCHNPSSFEWKATAINHDFFPLTEGHFKVDCNKCHTGGDYKATPTDCYSCHKTNFESSLNPNHKAANLPTNCTDCHTTKPGWQPAEFKQHDGSYFPVYSGKHKNQWVNCNDCHLNPSNYKEFSCVVCHKDPKISQEHDHVNGYFFNDQACLACHPTGSKDQIFNHNNTNFPLTGAHQQVDCNKCHVTQFKGTSTACVDCHFQNYNGTKNPNHNGIGISLDCASCHTTAAGWKPARFDNHDAFFVLAGAHKVIANECASCHKGNYINTPNTCAGCHINDYDKTDNPPHKLQQFSTDCASCHKETAWKPATFEHDGQYFPIYSGKHKGQWTDCKSCHINPANIKEFSCVVCHRNPETDNQHKSVNGYWYNDHACLACHPTGDKLDKFDHNSTHFPLTGAHISVDCKSCHSGGFAGTSTLCSSCHTTDFNNSSNPKHQKLGFSMDCASCHTTAPGWKPARLDNHNQYYQIIGAHTAIAKDCAACHKGNYNNTPNTCSGCHIEDYNKTIDPNHSTLKFSTDCASCHSQNAWKPSTFDHDVKHFPIYSGKHQGVWTECKDCHTNPSNINVVSCTRCHTNPETNNKHDHVPGYFYNDQACLACHPTGSKQDMFNHNSTAFPLTGAHVQTECVKCHQTIFKGTSSICADCHKIDFNSSKNPNHVSLGFTMDCASCHTTAPGWKPAKLANHDQYYVLAGAHKMIAPNCASCHNGNYTNTPNTCAGCHLSDYTKTKDPSHTTLQFSTDCASCHTQIAWQPATFEHDGMYFPIYSGKHKGLWNECKDCHKNSGNYKEFTCTDCHSQFETSHQHERINGFFFNNQACLVCHPTGSKQDMFDHNSTGFPLTGGHIQVDCKLCHASGFKGTPTTCESCHLNDFNGTQNPNHSKLGFSTNCASCHTTAPQWKPAVFTDHDKYYPLTGAHKLIATDCAACHKGEYNNTPNTCNGCHQQNYNQTQNPKHVDLGLSTDCATCHTTDPGWKPAQFAIHDNYYVLTGGHKLIASNCVACHNGNYNKTPNTCDACHQKNYTQTTNPSHIKLGFSTDCASCHTTNPGWQPAQMPNHDSYYVLTGAHKTIEMDCAACHKGNYKNTPNTCDACHAKDYNGTTNPNHKNLGLTMDCAHCHTTNPNWKPALFPEHNNFYQLKGAHATISNDCAACHHGNYTKTPNTCVGCHLADYNQAGNPNHSSQKFPKDCASCHTETAWIPSTFNHNNVYPLTGAHALIKDNCVICHNGNYSNTPNTCSGCHLTNYNQASNPNHKKLGFSLDCAMCHTTAPGWAPASMPNHDNYYPLLGAHLVIKSNCAACHKGNYNSTPNTCVGCHLDDYNQASNPNHASAQFPKTCETCHTVNAWKPSTFNHDGMYFPIYSGKHKNQWNLCSDCHNNSGNYAVFTCITCHEHNNKSEVDNQHQGVSGYSYNSNACYSCHPQGKK